MTASAYSQLSPLWNWGVIPRRCTGIEDGTVPKALDGYVHANYGQNELCRRKRTRLRRVATLWCIPGITSRTLMRSDITYISAQTINPMAVHNDSLTKRGESWGD